MNLDELFRRIKQAGADMEWTQGEGDNDSGGGGDGRRQPMGGLHIPKPLMVIAVILFVLVMGFTRIIDFYTDLLWFESLGLESVIWRRITPQVALFFASAVITFVFYYINWRRAVKIGTDEYRLASGDSSAVLVPSVWPALFAAVLSVLTGLGTLLNWPLVMQFLNSMPFGDKDAIFGLDVGFYIFSLPFFKLLQSWFSNMVLFTLAGSALLYLLCRALRNENGKITLVYRAKLHLFFLAALMIFVTGTGLWLSRYELLYSPTGIVFGIGYTDYHFRLTAITILAFAAMTSAVLLLVNFFKPMWKLSLSLIAALIVAGFLAQSVLPSIVQNYIVKPNEYELEKEFLGHHIKATRKAFGFDKVKVFGMTPKPEVTAAEMREDSETMQNIRLWDYGPLLRTYKQLQEIRTYYDFGDIDIDRYNINGKERQVMLSVRELDQTQLQSRTWVNTHLEFTHGYGVVMNPVNEMEEGGLPLFFMKDLPPKSSVPIKIDKPQIYYGEKPTTYALVKTDVKEFDYPMGDANMRSTYDGSGGVEVGSLLRRLLFAIHFRDSEILFTGSIKKESKVLYNRNVKNAIRKIAPFLILDEDMYPVICNGRIVWLQDAYTASSRYPYSRPLSEGSAAQVGLMAYVGANYIRNSVKVAVDAYDGTMKFYITDTEDPIIKSWAKIFPKLFVPNDKIPEELKAHFRYPEEFFEVQSEMYRIYHMTDANTYYNREDVWMTTPSGQERRIRPNYVTMQLMDEERPEFTLIAPFMPLGRNNLIGWMAGRCDTKHYGDLVVYQFPKQELVFGPSQIEALIDQNTVISSQLSLWSQRGSDVIRGDLLVIPIGKSLLYVQPLYLKAERGDLPELKRIILSTGGRVAWGETFDKALTELMGTQIDTGSKSGVKAQQPKKPEPSQMPQGASVQAEGSSGLAGLTKEARAHYDRAEEASRRGDWAKYGEELKKLGETLSKLEGLSTEK